MGKTLVTICTMALHSLEDPLLHECVVGVEKFLDTSEMYLNINVLQRKSRTLQSFDTDFRLQRVVHLGKLNQSIGLYYLMVD